MVALKWDEIWSKVSDFGLPFPPFAIGDGMDVEDVDRSEAEELGLIDPKGQVPRQPSKAFDEVQFRIAVAEAARSAAR